MRMNILIGGKAGQGINKLSEILSQVLKKQGYFIFNYRDYQSLIRGGHNFNVLSLSDEWIGSHESKMDILVPLDENTIELHKSEVKKEGVILDYNDFKNLGLNMNLAFAGAICKIFGISKQDLIECVKEDLGEDKERIQA
jgi:2-oxoglutarate ferredoxin oxidoreductase subunit alpha